jgi:hypothetical protein
MYEKSARETGMKISQKRIDKKIAEIRRDIEATELRLANGNPYARMELGVLKDNLSILLGGRGLVGRFLFSESSQ